MITKLFNDFIRMGLLGSTKDGTYAVSNYIDIWGNSRTYTSSSSSANGYVYYLGYTTRSFAPFPNPSSLSSSSVYSSGTWALVPGLSADTPTNDTKALPEDTGENTGLIYTGAIYPYYSGREEDMLCWGTTWFNPTDSEIQVNCTYFIETISKYPAIMDHTKLDEPILIAPKSYKTFTFQFSLL